ncbi:DHH family phosphoesterase [Prolixibacteraceae bacterium Z1-6]|uniref:DHH family phosphoesterase n=1 Tax=Draconibacterium aestuarii TaxID=2998507 RepID=A0A9X3F833_9BACT|nr:DHH family phosphoesterase [Prolixibacteraceae bacterium Z1-6]
MKNTEIEIITSVKQALAESKKKITIVPHENPDGDAIGSALGLGQVLQNFGHQVQIIPVNDYPDFLKWFSSDVPVIIFEKQRKLAKKLLFESDVLICVDFNTEKRAGHLEKVIKRFDRTKILIDHHPFPTDFCDFTVSETTYSSTAELVFDLVNSIGLSDRIESKSAEALFTGILTDTGGFNHNTSNNTFRVISNLMEFDINPDKIRSEVFHNFSADRMKLLGFCLNEKMKVFPEFRAAVISLTIEELERFKFKPGDTEGFVNYPLSINNIVFSALFIEKEGFVKASFRSKGNFPANEFSSKYFSGGGHLNAAGGESELDLEKTILKFTQLLPEFKHQLLETTI